MRDARLYLPAERAAADAHRERTHVPAEVAFQEKWRLALDLIVTTGTKVAHGGVAGDDEFGRARLALWSLQFEKRRRGKKTPGITVSVVRQFLTALLRCEGVERAAAQASQVLRRTEEARIYTLHGLK